MHIEIYSIPHDKHRYPTVGDYWQEGNSDFIKVSAMENPDHIFLVAVHELIEMWLTRKRGITEESISAFDIQYENNRPDGDVSEPGGDPEAPYQKEHQFSTKIERLIAEELGVNWAEYDEVVSSL